MQNFDKSDKVLSIKMKEFVAKCRELQPALDYLEVNELAPNYPKNPDGWWVSNYDASQGLQKALLDREHWPQDLGDAEDCFISAVSAIQLTQIEISHRLEEGLEERLEGNWIKRANWVLLCKRRYMAFLAAWVCQTELTILRQVAKHRQDFMFAGHSKSALFRQLFPQLDSIRGKIKKETATRSAQDQKIIDMLRDLRSELGLPKH